MRSPRLPLSPQLMTEFCPNCGNEVESLDRFTGWCSDCTPSNAYNRIESYLVANADELEHYIGQGHSFAGAVTKLHSENGRPKCVVCGDTIKRAARNAIFCRKTKECRKQARRYTYLYQEKGLSKTEALSEIFSELT